MADLTQEEWKLQLEGNSQAIILDVRTEDEVEEGMIPNALHKDIYKVQEFIDEINKLDKSKTYFVYCRSGNRSGQACSLMNSLGFENCHNLMGGFSQWTGDII